MNSKSSLVALIVIAIIAIGGYYYPQVRGQFGISAGPVFTEALEFLSGSSKQFVNATSSSNATLTLTGSDLAVRGAFYDTISFTKTGAVATTTWTFPATSTLPSILRRAGERADICLYVATSTGGAGLVIAEGTGWNFSLASSTVTVGAVNSNGGAVARQITGNYALCGIVMREFNSDFTFRLQSTPAAAQ